MPNVASLLERTVRWVRLPERIPALAFSGEESAVDLILYEVLRLLVDEVKADIGHINLLPERGAGGEGVHPQRHTNRGFGRRWISTSSIPTVDSPERSCAPARASW